MSYKYGIIINQNSGSVTPKLRAEIEGALKKSKLDYELQFVNGKDMSKMAKIFAKSGCTALVGGGGDGSMAPIAAIAAENNIPFGAFPFGTLNHFAKDMNIPTDIADLVEMLGNENIRQVDYATVNKFTFLNNSSIGIYPELVFKREEREKKIGKWPAAALSLAGIFRKPLKCYTLTIIQDGKETTVKTPFVFIGNNDYGIDSFGINRRDALDKGHLCMYVYKGESRKRLIWQLLRSIAGRPATGRLKATYPKKIIIKSSEPNFALAFDGEAVKESSPLTYEIQIKKLTVIVPK